MTSNLCDYGDSYIVLNGAIRIKRDAARDRKNRRLALKTLALLTQCISEIESNKLDNA